MKLKSTTSSTLILIVSAFLMVFGNITFFLGVFKVYPVNWGNSLFLLSLAVVFGSAIVFMFSLVCYQYTIKPVLIAILLLSATTAYFMDTYNVVINDVIVDSIINTDFAEASDLLSIQYIIYLTLLGILPSLFIYKVNIIFPSLRGAFISRLKLSVFSSVTALALIVLFGNFYASFFRENKPLRYYANPTYTVYSTGKYISKFFKQKTIPFQSIGLDAKIPASDQRRELIFFVIGETARVDRFSLNGYRRKTNPNLEKENVISFENFWSCGTATAVSVPCMFSIYKRSNYNKAKVNATENVLDILQRAGVNVLWLDNSTGSKGVADRVPNESYRTPDKNPICDIECRDEGMLQNLQSYIDENPQGDIFIVLHQMGNHGPAYYKRYPSRFEKFTPTCQTNQLEKCSREAINNAYDNAILYTDYFLAKAIKLLDKNNDKFESVLFYVSDHGESLGENNLYLHGLPYLLAPDAQKNIPVIMWFSDSFEKEEINFARLQANKDKKYSQDNIFHTILGLMEVETSVYDRSMDMIEREYND